MNKRITFQDYAGFNKWLLYLCGALPRKSANIFVELFFIISSMFSSFFIFVPGFYSLIFRWNLITATERFNILVEQNVHFICVIKVGILLAKREKLYQLTEFSSNLWLRYVKSEKDLAIVERYATRGLYLTYGFTINCILGVAACVLTPVFMGDFVLSENGTVLVSKRLPYSAGIFHEDVNIFYIWHSLQVPTALDGVLAVVATDTAISFYILHACAHMRLCRKLFRRIADDVDLQRAFIIPDADNIETKRKQLSDNIVGCILYHKQILKYTDDIENVFASVILVQALQSIAVICGYSFRAMLGDEADRPRGVVCSLAVTIQLLILCWPPDTLQDESLKVAHAVFDLPWYTWSRKEGTLICMIIAKSQRPVTITAKGFTAVSLQTFTWILRTAFSVITLLRKVL